MRKTITSSAFKPKCRHWMYWFLYYWLFLFTLYRISIAGCFPEGPRDCWAAVLVSLVASSEQQLTLFSLRGVLQDFNWRMLQAHISITPRGATDLNISSDDTLCRDLPTSAILKVLRLVTTLTSYRKRLWNWRKNSYNNTYLSRPWLKSFMAGRPAVFMRWCYLFYLQGTSQWRYSKESESKGYSHHDE